MPVYPVTYAGLRLTSTLYRSGQEDTYNKDASETARASAVIAADAELTGIALEASAEYEISIGLNLIGGSGAINVKTQWLYTGTWNNPIRRVDGPATSNTAAPNAAGFASQHATYTAGTSCTYGLSSSASFTTIWEDCKKVVTTTAGTMSLGWAPATGGATSGGVMLDSWVTVRRIA